MESSTKQLINAIEAERAKLKLNQYEFSDFLGITESLYSMLKTGSRQPSLKVLSIFMQKLPEITPEVTIYIMRQGNDGEFSKTSKKMEGKNTRAYIHVSPTPDNPKKPSKNAK